MVPKHFLPAYSRMLHLKTKRIRGGHLTNITNKQAGKDRQCTTHDRCGFKICEKLTLVQRTYMGQCDCSWRAHIWHTPVHLIKLVPPWKILVHPGVYDTPGWQALVYCIFILSLENFTLLASYGKVGVEKVPLLYLVCVSDVFLSIP